MTDPIIVLSVVAPVHDESAVLDAFVGRVTAVLDGIDVPWELLLVDDGSTDDSWAGICRHASPRIRGIRLSRNFGHQAAVTAGLEHAGGDAVVVIDADLQDPPEVIAEMVARWRAGAHVVYGQRTSRRGETRAKVATARWFYRLLNRLSDVQLPLDAGDFRLLDRRVVDALAQMPERDRYLRGMVAWVGFMQESVPYERAERAAGSTSYSLRRMIRFALDGVTSFSREPLRIATATGLVVTLLGATYILYVLGLKVLAPDQAVPGWATIVMAVLIMGGVQLLSIGVLGEYVGRVFMEGKRRPLYLVMDDTAPPDDH